MTFFQKLEAPSTKTPENNPLRPFSAASATTEEDLPGTEAAGPLPGSPGVAPRAKGEWAGRAWGKLCARIPANAPLFNADGAGSIEKAAMIIG